MIPQWLHSKAPVLKDVSYMAGTEQHREEIIRLLTHIAFPDGPVSRFIEQAKYWETQADRLFAVAVAILGFSPLLVQQSDSLPDPILLKAGILCIAFAAGVYAIGLIGRLIASAAVSLNNRPVYWVLDHTNWIRLSASVLHVSLFVIGLIFITVWVLRAL